MTNNVRVGVSTPGAKQAGTEVDKLRSKFTNLQKTSAKGLAIGAGAGAGLAAFNAVGMAIRGVTGYLGDAAQAYRDDQKSVASLTASLWANVAGFDGNVKAIEATIAARQRLGFSDDEQRTSLDSLVAITHDASKALDIQRTAMDLARLRSMDLGAATELLGKVAGGNVGILKRYGIVLKDGATATEALAEIQKMAAGQAEAYADTLDGKLLAAEIKAEEASEKFGKQLARLSAEILPVVADGIEGIANQVDGLQTAMDPAASATDKFDASLLALNSSMAADIPILRDVVGLLNDAADTDEGLRQLDGGVRVLASDLRGLPNVIEPATEELEELEDAARDTEREIGDLAKTISDELFGDAINAGNIAEMRQTHRELTKQREEARKGSPEWRRLTGEIAENQQRLFELQLQMKQKEGPRAVIAWLEDQKQLFGDASGAIQRLINKYRTLAGVITNLPRPPVIPGGGGSNLNQAGGGKRNRARGGPVTANTPYLVGEEGPEVVVPNANSTVIPNGGGMGGVTVNVTVQAPSGSDAKRWGQAVGDAAASVLRQQTARLPVGTRA